MTTLIAFGIGVAVGVVIMYVWYRPRPTIPDGMPSEDEIIALGKSFRAGIDQRPITYVAYRYLRALDAIDVLKANITWHRHRLDLRESEQPDPPSPRNNPSPR